MCLPKVRLLFRKLQHNHISLQVKMYTLLRVPLRELVFFKCFRHVSVSCISVRRGWNARKTVPCISTLQSITHTGNITGFRLYSPGRRTTGGSIQRTRKERMTARYTTIDIDKPEEFTFLDDYSEPRKDLTEDFLLKEYLLNTASTVSTDQQSVSNRAGKNDQRTLEKQLLSLKVAAQDEIKSETLIEFYDTDFPLENIITKKKRPKGEQKIYGSPDTEEPVSNTCCSGCGAVLHCTAPDIAGYLPSEKYKVLREEDELKRAICQRCYLLLHHQKALAVKMTKDEYREIVHGVKFKKALVLLIVDLMDLRDSIIPNLLDLIGKNKHIVVLGNKVDLLPGDAENYLHRIKRQLATDCADASISDNVKEIHLISAKTGYGIEKLISSLQRSWKYKGDVYLVGTANAGKSTLFNTLLESDYCKSKASDVIQKATISPWPGTTLNLLKFPIINPTPYRMLKRLERLKVDSNQSEGDLSPQELKRLQQFSNQGYLVGRIGRTFRVEAGPKRTEFEFDPDSLAYGEDTEEEEKKPPRPPAASTSAEFTHNELKDAHWLYDTPGLLKEKDVLNLLSEQEIKMVVPTRAIVPRTFVVQPGTTLFLGALGRIDYLQGEKSCWLSVVASARIPVHITSLEKADSIYLKHAGHTLLGVPLGGEERMKTFPPLVSQEVLLVGLGCSTAAADIKMSSAGWVAVTGMEGDHLSFRVHFPAEAGLSVRTPPLLPHIVKVKGQRISKSSAYKPQKPPALVDTGLSHKGAERLKVKKKKKKL